METLNPSPNGQHQHLSEEALWEMAEAMVLEAKDGAVRETETIALAQACPLCAPKLQAASRQIASMRSLPEIKAPPDFLLLVQNRIEAEGTLLKRLLATLRSWVMPRRAVGVPMGFASAMLLVLVLIVVMPRQENKDEAIDQPAEPVALEVNEATAPSAPKNKPITLQKEKHKAKTDESRRASLAKDGASAKNEFQASTSPKGNGGRDDVGRQAQRQSMEGYAIPSKKGSVALSAPSPIESEPPLAMASEAPASPAGGAQLADAPARAMARAKLSELADMDAKSESKAGSSADSKADDSEAREVFIKRAGNLSPLPLQHLGDTLLFVGNKQHALTLGRLADSLGIAAKTHVEVRGDSVYFRLLP